MQRQMRVQSIRFGEADWRLIQRMAELDGLSASQFVREAAIARCAFIAGVRGESWEDLAAEIAESMGEDADAVQESLAPNRPSDRPRRAP